MCKYHPRLFTASAHLGSRNKRWCVQAGQLACWKWVYANGRLVTSATMLYHAGRPGQSCDGDDGEHERVLLQWFQS